MSQKYCDNSPCNFSAEHWACLIVSRADKLVKLYQKELILKRDPEALRYSANTTTQESEKLDSQGQNSGTRAWTTTYFVVVVTTSQKLLYWSDTEIPNERILKGALALQFIPSKGSRNDWSNIQQLTSTKLWLKRKLWIQTSLEEFKPTVSENYE